MTLLYFAISVVVLVVLYSVLTASNRPRGLRKNAKHKNLVDTRYFRVYYSGVYALWEIDFGRIARNEFVLLLGNIDRYVSWSHNKPLG